MEAANRPVREFISIYSIKMLLFVELNIYCMNVPDLTPNIHFQINSTKWKGRGNMHFI